jgi:very-short-patch-repair endonuclease
LHQNSKEQSEKISNSLKKLYSENPDKRKLLSDLQKNGASIFTKQYWIKKGFTEEESINKIHDIQKKNSIKSKEKVNHQEYSHFCIPYWIKKGFTDEEARKKISENQAILSARSSKFLGHIRTDEQKIKISNGLKKMIDITGAGEWASHFGEFNGRSNAEIELYNFVVNTIDSTVRANIPIGKYIVDMIRERDKKIIEFNGDFWHANPKFYEETQVLKGFLSDSKTVKEIWEKDLKRNNFLKERGYDILVIWENDWNKHREDCIEKIKKYLL